jgi:mono/diheme cytochrome c family protein
MPRIVDSGSRSRTALAAMLALVCALAVPAAQTREDPPKNPFQPNPTVLQEGMAAFRANCAYCHGMDGRGARGPDLTGIYASGHTEESLYPLVRAGVPGTEMPPASVFLQEPDTWKVLMYLRTLGIPPAPEPHGNTENGERIFRAQCASCHQVNARGGVLGPDLSRIGIAGHGLHRTAAGIRQVRRQGRHLGKAIHHAGLQCRSAERTGSQRPAAVPGYAARQRRDTKAVAE